MICDILKSQLMECLVDLTLQTILSRKTLLKQGRKLLINTLLNVMCQNIHFILEEASKLVREAGGKLVLAHPNDPHGTSLVGVN